MVRKGTHKKTKEVVAVKCVAKKDMDYEDLELLRKEVEIMKILQHDNIVKLHDVFESKDSMYIIMEILNGQDLFKWLDKRDFKLAETTVMEIVHKIAVALYYMHSFGIAHRDLKPENILMTSQGDDAELKLVDFGLSKMIGPTENCLEPFGTLSYAAPEVLLQKPYNKKVDVFSLGVIMFMMLGGFLPFDDLSEKKIAKKTIYDEPDYNYKTFNNISSKAKSLMKCMLTKSTTQRFTIEEVLQHEWFADNFESVARLRKLATNQQEKFEAFTSHK